MRLPGSIAQRLDVINRGTGQLLGATEVTELEDEGVAIQCRLEGTAPCIRLCLPKQGIKMLRGQKCADFALLLERAEDVFEAHILEFTTTVSLKKWDTVREQLEWATLHVLAAAGILGIRIQGVVFYTVHHREDLSREGSRNPAVMKIPVSPRSEADAIRWAEARRSWESGRVSTANFGVDVEHLRIHAGEDGRTAVTCRPRSSSGEDDTLWVFEPVAG